MDFFTIGKIGRSHGVQGFVRIISYSGELDHFFNLHDVRLSFKGKEKNLTIVDTKMSGETLLMKFQGFESPEAVRTLTGWELVVPRESGAPLGEDEYYIADLVGCLLVSDGKELGEVVSVSDGPTGELLEVKTLDGVNHYVPFMHRYIGTVDMKKRNIEILAPWLFE